MKTLNLVIVGNGFDLSHGLPTTFDAFVNECNNFDFIDMFNLYKEVSSWNEFEILINDYFSYECILDSYTRDINEKLSYSPVEGFEMFKSMFKLYIEKKINNKKITVNSNIVSALKECDYILNFNFTHSVCKYGFKRKNIFVHGDYKNDIILGCTNSLNSLKSPIVIIYEVNKIGQLYHNKILDSYWDIFRKIFSESFDEVIIINIGFSFGKSDILFTELLNKELQSVNSVSLRNFEFIEGETASIAAKLGIEKYKNFKY